MQFIGRQHELFLIRRRLTSDRSEALLVYGRRRVGKSELIKEALKGIDAVVIHYVCRKTSFSQNLAGLTRATAQAFDESFIDFSSIDKLLKLLSIPAPCMQITAAHPSRNRQKCKYLRLFEIISDYMRLYAISGRQMGCFP